VNDGINPTGYSQVVIEDTTLNGGEEKQYGGWRRHLI
jgi:hypothetical protein